MGHKLQQCAGVLLVPEWKKGARAWQFRTSNKFDNCLWKKVMKAVFSPRLSMRPPRGSKFLTNRHRGWHCRRRTLLASEIPPEWMAKWIAVMLPCDCLQDQGSPSAQSSFKTLTDLLCPCHLSMPLLIKGSTAILTPQCALIENLWRWLRVTGLIQRASRVAPWILLVALLSVQEHSLLTDGAQVLEVGIAEPASCWRQQKLQRQGLCWR